MLKRMDLEDQLKFCRNQNKELKEEVTRLKMLLNGEDVLMNSLPSSKDCTSKGDNIKSNK